MLLGLLSGKWLVSTMVLIPQTSTFMLSAQFREAGCLGPQTATAHSYVLGLSPQTQPRPWNCRMPPPPNPNSQPPASAYTVRGQGTTWVSLGLSGKQCGPDINSLTAAIAL